MLNIITLKERDWFDLITDPVMAAEILLGAEFDTAAAVALRLYWFVPNVMDHSGVSSGKTEVTWTWACLRQMLLPHPAGFESQKIALYYPTKSQAKEAIGDRFDKTIERSKIFRREIETLRGGRYALREIEGTLEIAFRNGGKIRLPATDMKGDAKNQASRRYHHGAIDEFAEIDLASDALDKQLLQRINAPCPQPDHPLFTNHIKLSGHAEGRNHPAYQRYKVWKSIIRDGSQFHALHTRCFRDWSPVWRKRIIKPLQVRADKLKLTEAAFEQRWGGIWAEDSDQWFSAKDIEACENPNLVPMNSIPLGLPIITAAGADTAADEGKKSDHNAYCVLGAIPVDPSTLTTTIGIYTDKFSRYWRIVPVFGIGDKALSNSDAGDLSGLTHSIDLRFNCSRYVFDPHGGGSWVIKELPKTTQTVENQPRQVVGLCDVNQINEYPLARALIHRFTHGQMFLRTFLAENWFRSAEGPIEAMMREMKTLFRQQAIQLFPSAENRKDLKSLDPTQLQTQRFFDSAISQLLKMEYEIQTGADRIAKRTTSGYMKFFNRGKKDNAYAFMYSLSGLLSLLNDENYFNDGE